MRTSVAQIFAFGLAASSAVSAHQVSGGRIAGFGLAVYAAPAVAAPLNDMMVALTNKVRQVTSAPSTGGPDISGDNGDDAQDEADDAKDDAQDRADDNADAADDEHDDYDDQIDAIIDAVDDAADDGSFQKRKFTFPGNVQGASAENPTGLSTGDTYDGGPRADGTWPGSNAVPASVKANELSTAASSTALDATTGILSTVSGNAQGASNGFADGTSIGNTHDGGPRVDGTWPGSNSVPATRRSPTGNNVGTSFGDTEDGGPRPDGTWPGSQDVKMKMRAARGVNSIGDPLGSLHARVPPHRLATTDTPEDEAADASADAADAQDDEEDDAVDSEDDSDDSQDDDEDDEDDSDDDDDDSQDDDEDDAAAASAPAPAEDPQPEDNGVAASAPAPAEDPQPEDNGVGVVSADHFVDPVSN
jgi:hypothetical protein